MKIKRLLMILLIVFLALVGITAVMYSYINRYDMIIYDMDLTVIEDAKIGVNSDTDALHFGALPPGAVSARRVNITNNKDFPLLFKIALNGALSDWVTVSNSRFILEPHGQTELVFTARVPDNANISNYSGEACIYLKRY